MINPLNWLHTRIAPDKTYIGKAHKGFDFLGKRIHPNGILPSASAVSRMQQKTIRLYEQGASKKRIGLYWVRWLCWVMPVMSAPAAWGAECTFAGSTSSTTSSDCVCFDASFAIQAGVGLTRATLRVRAVTTSNASIGDLLAPGIVTFTNGTSTATPQQQFSCTLSASGEFSAPFIGAASYPATVTAPTNPGVFGGEKITPTRYQVIVSKVEFKNTQGVFVTLAEQGTSYDYAAVGANTSVGTFGKTAGLPNGDYTHIRVTLSDAMVLTASGTDKSAACRTSSSGSTGNVSDQLTDAAIGSNDGGTATQQALTFPNGSTATGALTTAGLTEVGSTLQIIKPASFSITDESNPPNIAINVDVKDSVEVLTSSGNCHVLPQPPKLTVVVTAG